MITAFSTALSFLDRNAFNFQSNPQTKNCYYLHFEDEEAEIREVMQIGHSKTEFKSVSMWLLIPDSHFTRA